MSKPKVTTVWVAKDKNGSGYPVVSLKKPRLDQYGVWDTKSPVIEVDSDAINLLPIVRKLFPSVRQGALKKVRVTVEEVEE